MPAEGTTNPWWKKAWPDRPRQEKAASDDAFFMDAISDFSRKLGERDARKATDPIEVARERQAAIKAYDRARLHRQVLTACVAVGALAALGIASLAPPVSQPQLAPPASVAEAAEPAAPAAPPTAEALAQPFTPPGAPAPVPQAPPVRTASLANPPLAATQPPPAEPQGTSKPAEPEAAVEPLTIEEVRDIQTRLRGYGFNPGPADGVAGPMTVAAVVHYQQNRNQPQTGKIDRALLEQIRQDPTPQAAPPPQVAQRQARPARYHAPGPLDRLGRWLDSLVR